MRASRRIGLLLVACSLLGGCSASGGGEVKTHSWRLGFGFGVLIFALLLLSVAVVVDRWLARRGHKDEQSTPSSWETPPAVAVLTTIGGVLLALGGILW